MVTYSTNFSCGTLERKISIKRKSMKVITNRPLPSSSFVQCCSQVVVTGLVPSAGVVVVVEVVFAVSCKLKKRNGVPVE